MSGHTEGSSKAYILCDQAILDSMILKSLQKYLQAGEGDESVMLYYRPAHSRIHLLDYNIKYWKDEGIPRHGDENEAINTPASKIYYYNKYVLKGGKWKGRPNRQRTGRVMQSSVEDRVGTAIPGIQGLFVMDPLGTGLEEAAFTQMRAIFPRVRASRDPRIHDPDFGSGRRLTILFFNKKAPVTCKMAMTVLQELGYHELSNFIHAHYKAIQYLIQAPTEVMDNCSLTLVKYEQGEGLIAHIDGIGDFGNTFGPVFTIGMSEGAKYLDLFPVMTMGREAPVRLITQRYQTVMIQGAARSAWAHCIPSGNTSERYTIAFKFPDIPGARHSPPYECTELGTVPQITLRPAPA